MPLFACGINHKTAPLALREKVVFNKGVMPTPLFELVTHACAKEAAILSTCNRTELYCAGNDPERITNWLMQHQKLSQHELEPCLYIHQDQAAVRHMLRVASGLDSMVLGESQILGQLKTAYYLANTAGTLGKHLHRLFQYVFSVSKYIRTQTAIGAHPVSIASAAVNLANRIFANLKQIGVLLIGAGEAIELVARYFQAAGITRFWVANRTLTRAEKLARRIQGFPISLGEIANCLPQADAVISATESPVPILGKGVVERALKVRKRRLMFMMDLAVPRDIEPEVGDLSDVYLYTLDDLQAIIQQNLHSRHDAAHQAEMIIEAQSLHYMHSLKVLDAVPVINAYRNKAAGLRDAELAKISQLLESGHLTGQQALERLAYRLTNKLLHGPTAQLRHAAYTEQSEMLLLAQQLFGLTNE